MSAIYDLFETPSPNKEEKQPLHARIVSKGTVDKEEFLDRVHKFTGISRSLLAGAMEAFANEARDLLADGWNVEMGNFGFFSTSLQCPPVKDKKEIRAASVQMKNINFRASRPFKKEVGDKMRLQRGESITRPKKNSISRETRTGFLPPAQYPSAPSWSQERKQSRPNRNRNGTRNPSPESGGFPACTG